MRETIFDPVRKKRVALTPEERVRQDLIILLTTHYGYPLSLMQCEYSLVINGVKHRGDLVVFDNRANPLLLAECKAPGVSVKQETFDQIFRYNIALKVNYLLVTNGKETFLAEIDNVNRRYKFIDQLPAYNELTK